MSTPKYNRRIRPESSIGYDADASHLGKRFVNRDGSFNLRKRGWSVWKRISIYSYLLEISWLKFLVLILLVYTVANLLFTTAYILVGLDQLSGFIAEDRWSQIKETFFFSMQSFTTVGYGRIDPVADGAHIVSSVETFTGWVFFAMVTGLVYGRFTRPKAYLAFSDKLLVSPYNDGLALMFRVVPYKEIHQLSDAKATVTLSLLVTKDGSEEFVFYPLKLEREKIDMFNMNWTIIHPVDGDSPVYQFSEEDFYSADFELMVQVSGYDPVYSNQVMQRTSYTYKDLVWGARFCSMYHPSNDGKKTILDLQKLHWYEKAELPSS